MQRVIALLLATMIFSMSVTGCGGRKNPDRNPEKGQNTMADEITSPHMEIESQEINSGISESNSDQTSGNKASGTSQPGTKTPVSESQNAKNTGTKDQTVNSGTSGSDSDRAAENQTSDGKLSGSTNSPQGVKPAASVAAYSILDPTEPPEGGMRNGVAYVPWDGIVEHLFFHPVVAYPELAFDGDTEANGIDDYMVTVGEYNKILQSVYNKGYILVDIGDVWREVTNENGETRMTRNTLYVPEGKKPLILSFDDVNYYPYMLKNGFTYKLVLDHSGKIVSSGLDPQGKEVISRELDAIPILDKFVEEHPDFSPFGAKGSLSLTGYEGILGYRTQTTTSGLTAEQEANRQKEREAVKPVIAELKRTGWTFGSHTWGHIRLGGSISLDAIRADTQRWLDEVGSLVGETSILYYPHGERPDGDDWKKTGQIFQYLQSMGFRVFCSVGIESFSYIKKDINAVICDRLHPDGTTLRYSRTRYLPFYDAKDIMDVAARPQRNIKWD